MPSSREVEHFVTLFDANYLPMGMALHESLMQHAQPFHLWILCMDEQVKRQLRLLSLQNTTLIPLDEVETPELLEVKTGRTRGEYCWTMTPFSAQAVFDRAPHAKRVTYLDADLFFFADPAELLSEFEQSDRDVMITEHAYDPKYDQSETSGRFCVQFMTFQNTQEAKRVMKWWQERCVEWCFARVEDGKCGDQKYLDLWPDLFKSEVYILTAVDKTLAPWNVDYFGEKLEGHLTPVFYHFHGLRIVARHRVRLFLGFRIGRHAKLFYQIYVASLRRSLAAMANAGIAVPCIQEKIGALNWLRRIKYRISGITRTVRI